jgi:pectin methylesterase-like acyl-CoA thioesterase
VNPRSWGLGALALVTFASTALAGRITAGATEFPTLQAAVDALPDAGGEILLAPGTYREKVNVARAHVRLRGTGRKPGEAVIVWGDAHSTVGGTIKSATLTASGDDFRADNLTIRNDFTWQSNDGSQAVALAVTGDRAEFRRVRLLGAQDTLYAGSRKCAAEPCPVSRQYFRDCYIEGHVDFIFGDANAFFDRCEIHALAHPEIMLTAHSRTAPEQEKAYVFDHCRITADPGAGTIYLGRPWRDYARVIFMNTRMDAAVHPEGWREWTPGATERLKTAYYAEYRPRGPHASVAHREPLSHQLSAAEAQRWQKRVFLAGGDGWQPGR